MIKVINIQTGAIIAQYELAKAPRPFEKMYPRFADEELPNQNNLPNPTVGNVYKAQREEALKQYSEFVTSAEDHNRNIQIQIDSLLKQVVGYKVIHTGDLDTLGTVYVTVDS